ncbi:flagellar hook protein FlgE [Pokkaliibacter sp. CJK22405]|uniref:flagellar hook protein FlgE n=1 Tax=Pokkaliibacter sp. CJK22405 TaxID=3384615 RepID=UPI0039850974
MSFSTAITGLKAASTDLDVRGNNIANASTTGFKSSRAEFGDIYSSSVAGGGSSRTTGNGVSVQDIQQNFASGTLENTDNNLDLAIDGDGFFSLKDTDGTVTYTRSGAFELIPESGTSNTASVTSVLRSNSGSAVQGRLYNDDGQLVGGTTDITIDATDKVSAPEATSAVTVSVQIDSTLDPDDLRTPYDPTDSSTYTYGTTQTVYDSLGNEQTLAYQYVEVADPNDPSATNDTTYYVVHVLRVEDDGTYTELPVGLRDGTTTDSTVYDPSTSNLIYAFNRSSGTLTGIGIGSVTAGTTGTAPVFTDATGQGLQSATSASAPTVYVDNADPTIPAVTTYPATDDINNLLAFNAAGTTQYSQDSQVNNTFKDGHAAGTLTDVSFDENGNLVASYSNGESKKIAQIQLYTFDNPTGLKPVGDTEWAATASSGTPVGNPPGVGLNGSLVSGSLESSNVDLSEELVGLIIAQRNYQANSKTLDTENNVTQTILNIG